MNDIRQERPNQGPVLIFNKRLYTQPLNKKFAIHVEKPMIFKNLKKINSVSFLQNKIINGKPPWG